MVAAASLGRFVACSIGSSVMPMRFSFSCISSGRCDPFPFVVAAVEEAAAGVDAAEVAMDGDAVSSALRFAKRAWIATIVSCQFDISST